MPFRGINVAFHFGALVHLKSSDSGVGAHHGIMVGVLRKFIVVSVKCQTEAHNAVVGQQCGVGWSVVGNNVCGRKHPCHPIAFLHGVGIHGEVLVLHHHIIAHLLFASHKREGKQTKQDIYIWKKFHSAVSRVDISRIYTLASLAMYR